MIQESKKLYLFILFTFFLVSCQNTFNNHTVRKAEKLYFQTTPDNEFIVIYEDGSMQVLSTDGSAYEYHLSPKGKFLAVDYTKLSNLQISKLFEKMAKNRFIEVANLSGIAWKSYENKKKFEMDNVINPRSRVLKLSDEKVLIQLSGTLEDGSNFSEKTEIDLQTDF